MKGEVSTGLRVYWHAAHRDGQGNLISFQAIVEPPAPPTCISFRCLWHYGIESLKYALILSYHKRRVIYAETNRRKKILERYRTGEPSPETLWQAIHANIKLTCPICRKYEGGKIWQLQRNRQ